MRMTPINTGSTPWWGGAPRNTKEGLRQVEFQRKDADISGMAGLFRQKIDSLRVAVSGYQYDNDLAANLLPRIQQLRDLVDQWEAAQLTALADEYREQQ